MEYFAFSASDFAAAKAHNRILWLLLVGGLSLGAMSEVAFDEHVEVAVEDSLDVACLNIEETNSSHLSELMIGRRLDTPSWKTLEGVLTSETPVRMRVQGISLQGESKKILDNISLDIRCGEILGLAGVDGNGQKELAEVIVGIRKSDNGQIVLDGRDISRLGVKKRKTLGIAYVPDDRHPRQGQ